MIPVPIQGLAPFSTKSYIVPIPISRQKHRPKYQQLHGIHFDSRPAPSQERSSLPDTPLSQIVPPPPTRRLSPLLCMQTLYTFTQPPTLTRALTNNTILDGYIGIVRDKYEYQMVLTIPPRVAETQAGHISHDPPH